ncbi:MAG TPA: SpoIIE family protein phosphatase [Thermoleophilaceae bacterium]|jgi:GAF domain-containing protein/anti-sigma regulatory factor (Ser/Thr protein kinase)
MAASGPGGEPLLPRVEGGGADLARLRHLESITEAALGHLDLDDLLDELLTRLRVILGVDTAAVLLLDPEAGEVVARAAKGLEEEVEAGVRIPLGKGFAGRVASERRAIHIEDVATADILNPLLREKGVASLLGVPLVVAGEVLGTLHVGTLTPRTFTQDDVELLQLAADRMALAIDHARLYEAERDARAAAERSAEQLHQLQSITDVALGQTLDDELLVRLLVRLREVLAVDTAAVLLVDAEGLELVARATAGLEEEVEEGVRIPLGEGFAGRIASEKRPVKLDDVVHEDVVNPILLEKGIRSLLGVPLLVEGRAIGVLHVGSLVRRAFTRDETALLELAADRIAGAIDRARKHGIAEVLQRRLLPARLPELGGLSMAARYLPGADDSRVGGDWYDVLSLPEDRAGVVMGDVVSRGVRAAAAMGQLRTALRAYAVEGDAPGRVLDRLARLIRSTDDREMATVAYAVLHPGTGELSYSLAGHPPPLVIPADGEPRFLAEIPSSPVGVGPGAPHREATAALAPGDVLLLFTDGLIERRGESIDEGFERLREAARAGPRAPEQLCDHLLATMETGADDVALLAIALTGTEGEALRLRVAAVPESLAGMRRSLRDWLSACGARDEDAYDVLVAAGEAASNAVEHAYGPGDAEFEVTAEAFGGDLSLTIRDSGSWRPARGQNRGRGIDLMRVLMDDVDVDHADHGTTVRMRRALRRGE